MRCKKNCNCDYCNDAKIATVMRKNNKKECDICNGTGTYTNCFDQIFSCKCKRKKKKRSKEPTHADIIMLGLYVCLMTRQKTVAKKQVLQQAEQYLLKRNVLKENYDDRN